jgi:hypothetical protein
MKISGFPSLVFAINSDKLCLKSEMLFFFFSYSLTSFSKTSAKPSVTPIIASFIPSVLMYLSAIAFAIIGAMFLDSIAAFFNAFLNLGSVFVLVMVFN